MMAYQLTGYYSTNLYIPYPQHVDHGFHFLELRVSCGNRGFQFLS
jgi:hypothetical protein